MPGCVGDALGKAAENLCVKRWLPGAKSVENADKNQIFKGLGTSQKSIFKKFIFIVQWQQSFFPK